MQQQAVLPTSDPVIHEENLEIQVGGRRPRVSLRRVLAGLFVAVFFLAGGPARGAEQHLEFVQALRDRGYHDYALLYLEQLEQRNNIPEDVRQVLLLEEALTLLEGVDATSDSTEQHRQLDAADAKLRQFLQEHPDHERAAEAAGELGQVLVNRGRVDVFQTRSSSNMSRKPQLQQSAREWFHKARDVFADAVKKNEAAYEKFPPHVNQKTDPQLYREKRAVEQRYYQAQFNLALVTYYESETYDAGSKENQELLKKAMLEFEDLHKKYRVTAVGLYARMWQGKCFEELGDTRGALGLYNELLGHPGNNESLAHLKDTVQRFRMVCLNTREDYKLVLQEAEQWINERVKTARDSRRGSLDHVGILWERALAEESLATAEGTPDNEKTKYFRDALADLEYVKTHSAEYRALADEKIRVIRARLNIGEKEPETFADALAMGQSLVRDIGDYNRDYTDAQAAGDEQAAAEASKQRKDVAERAVRMLNLALRLADNTTDTKELNQARYLLAVAYFYYGDHDYDAAVVGEFIARRYKDLEPAAALDAAYLSMTAYIRIFNADHAGQAADDVDEASLVPVMRMAELITTNWPDQPKANDARLLLGDFYNRLKQYDKAAAEFQQVGKDADQLQEAQIKTGQAYWNAYVTAPTAADGEQPAVTEQTKQQWLDQARQNLTAGISGIESKVADDGTPPELLINAKLTLAMLNNETGDFAAAVELLSGNRFPVLKYVATDGPRPAAGITSEKFATAAYRQALRAYVGTRDIPKAQEVLNQLEGLGSQDAIINQLVQLGKQLQEEVARLKARNDPRLPDVVKSFEDFLTSMYQRENQTVQSLFWVGLTYYDLGQGLSNGQMPPPAPAQQKYARAAEVFAEALKRCESDPQLAKPEQVADLKLRLVKAWHQQGEFAKAQELVTQLLSERPRAINVQVEAAMLLTDWAAADPSHAAAHLEAAIGGVEPAGGGEKIIWGWGMLSQKLMIGVLQSGNADPQPELVEAFAEARYWLAVSRRRMALAQTKTDEQVRMLELALLDINSTVRAGADFSQTPWWAKFNALNKEIHRELGREVPPDFEKPQTLVAENPLPEAGGDVPEEAAPAAAPQVTPTAAAPSPAESGSLTLIIAGVLTLAFIAVLTYLILTSGKKKPRRYR